MALDSHHLEEVLRGKAAKESLWLFEGSATSSPPKDVPRFCAFVAENDPERESVVRIFADFVLELSQRGLAVAPIVLRPLTDLRLVLEEIKKDVSALVFLALPSAEAMRSQWLTDLVSSIAAFATSKGLGHLLSVNIEGTAIPGTRFRSIADVPQPRSAEDVQRWSAQVANHFFSQATGLIVEREERKEQQQRIEKNAAVYVVDAVAALHEREKRWRRVGQCCHASGFLTLLAGIGAVLYFSSQVLGSVQVDIQWPLVAYFAIKSIIVVGLLVAASKYAFTIGRSYMNESLKNADRVHAINFGTFYLQAYGTSATWNDLKEVFQHWNIARDSGFAALDSAQFDPQLLSTAIDIAKNLSGSKSGSK